MIREYINENITIEIIFMTRYDNDYYYCNR